MTSDETIAALQANPPIDFCDTDCEDVVWLFSKCYYGDEQDKACEIYQAALTNPKVLGCMRELAPVAVASVVLIGAFEKLDTEDNFVHKFLKKLGL